MTDNNNCCPQCQQQTYLPVRSSWARAALSKVQSDQHLENIDRRAWYRLSRSDLLKDEYRALFQELYEDAETTAFLEASETKSDNIPVQILHSLASSLLTMFIARTSGMSIRIFMQKKHVKKNSLGNTERIIIG
jgi:hypothetical protein